jgi:hypothetical protein
MQSAQQFPTYLTIVQLADIRKPVVEKWLIPRGNRSLTLLGLQQLILVQLLACEAFAAPRTCEYLLMDLSGSRPVFELATCYYPTRSNH